MSDKNQILDEIKQRADGMTLRKVGELIDCLIQEIRVANDDAAGDECLRNQGKIHFGKMVKLLLKLS